MREFAEPKPPLVLRVRLVNWMVGLGLLVVGVIGLGFDRSLFYFDIACIIVGLLALPPVTGFVRRLLPQFTPGRHGVGAVLATAAALWWSMESPPQSTNAHFTALRENGGEARAPWLTAQDAELKLAAAHAAELEQSKQAVLAQIAKETEVLRGGVQPASFIGDRDTVMDGARRLAAWRALAEQARALQLNEYEAEAAKAFQDLLATERNALGPALRQSYAVSLRDQLAAYSVTAHVLGPNAETIRFKGAALADPAVQDKLKALLGKDIATLGYANVEFAVEADAQHAASEDASTTL